MSDFISSNCILKEFSTSLVKESFGFSCGDPDLDEFFLKDAETYRSALMGKNLLFCIEK